MKMRVAERAVLTIKVQADLTESAVGISRKQIWFQSIRPSFPDKLLT